jgi:hypothetical protein
MEHDFIDPDEGYRDTDWDASRREPEAFYTEALPCESCGKPCDCERQPASYDPSLLVGPCCQDEEVEIPDEPVCPRLYMALMFSDSVSQIMLHWKLHNQTCPVCRKPDAGRIRKAA